MRKRLPVYVTAFLFSSLLAACSLAQHQRQAAVLADVETYVNEKPDSALIVLRGLDSMVTRSSPALQARFSLLHTMALDKCYSDITAPGLLDPAIKWFTRFGSADEKMKTLYYQGRVLPGTHRIHMRKPCCIWPSGVCTIPCMITRKS